MNPLFWAGSSPKRLDGVQHRCTARWQIAREQGDPEKQKRRENKGRQIVRANSVQHGGHQPGQQQRSRQAKCNSGYRQNESVAHDKVKDVCVFRPERESNSELLPPQRYRIRQHSIDSDHRERKCGGGKNTQQHHDEAWLGAGTVHEFVDRLNVGHWLVWVHGGDLRSHSRCQAPRFHGSAASLRMITGLPSGRPSSSMKLRPICGYTPSKEKKLGEIRATGTWSGSPEPVRFRLSFTQTATDSNDWL